MRLDKFLCEMNQGTRSQVKDLIRKKQVSVNGTIVTKPETQIQENTDRIVLQGREICYQKYVYYMLNKPRGFVSATTDSRERTVLDLLGEQKANDLFPVGRLDKDTEGLLLITNNGDLAHRLLSPKKHVDKTYLVSLDTPLSDTAKDRLEQGVDIGEEKLTAPARVERVDEHRILLTIQEGKFHQVKRMLQAVSNEVLFLKRVRMGTLQLDPQLAPGEYRYLTTDEVESLKTRVPSLEQIQAVIFDVDGSMVDSMWMWKKLDMEYLQKKNIVLPDDLQSSIEGLSFYQTAEYFKERFGIEDSVDRIMDEWNQMAYDKYEHEVPLKEGVREFLDLCKSKNIKMGIATSNSRELFSTLSRVHGLDAYISCVKTGSEVIHGKPAPDIYLMVAEQLDVKPENCLVFEDIVAGIMAGKNAGMSVCAVQDAYSMDTDVEKHLCADYYIENYHQILEKYRK